MTTTFVLEQSHIDRLISYLQARVDRRVGREEKVLTENLAYDIKVFRRFTELVDVPGKEEKEERHTDFDIAYIERSTGDVFAVPNHVRRKYGGKGLSGQGIRAGNVMETVLSVFIDVFGLIQPYRKKKDQDESVFESQLFGIDVSI